MSCFFRCFLILAAGLAVAAPLRELAVHQAVRTTTPPTVDGRLDEACWAKAPAFDRYRHDGGKNFQPTRIQIVWDDRGITFGVVNVEAHPERLRMSVRTRDGGQVWADDSNEFYVDPTATRYSLFKFDVNAIGTIADTWQPDPGFVDMSWSGSSTRAGAVVGEDAWTLEFFVSWADLKRTPAAGDVWMFYHRRLAWTDTDGKLTVSSTTGGNYTNRIWGFIVFTEGELPAPLALGERLALAREPWVTPVGEQWLWANADGEREVATPGAVIAHYRDRARQALDAARDLAAGGDAPQGALAKLDKRFAAAADQPPVDAAATYQSLIGEARELRDEIALQQFLANAQ